MLKKQEVIFYSVVFVLGFTFSFSGLAETITLSTYYPAPFGIYHRLGTNSLGVGDVNHSGGIDAGDVPDPTDSDNEGDVWIAGDVLINGGLGIGTAKPRVRLDVDGGVKIGMVHTCNQERQGTLRYEETKKSLEFCNGIMWQSAVGGGATTASYIGDGLDERLINVGFRPVYVAIYSEPFPIIKSDGTKGVRGPEQFHKTNMMPDRCVYYYGNLPAALCYPDSIEIVDMGFKLYESTTTCCGVPPEFCESRAIKTSNRTNRKYHYVVWGKSVELKRSWGLGGNR